MKNYINGRVIDITYKSELTPHPASNLHGYGFLGVG